MGYYNNERRHSRLEYRSPVEYLTSVGFIPKMLAAMEVIEWTGLAISWHWGLP